MNKEKLFGRGKNSEKLAKRIAKLLPGGSEVESKKEDQLQSLSKTIAKHILENIACKPSSPKSRGRINVMNKEPIIINGKMINEAQASREPAVASIV